MTTATGTRFLTREETEARCRELMAKRARTPLTWQTRADRTEMWTEIHRLLDEWLERG